MTGHRDHTCDVSNTAHPNQTIPAPSGHLQRWRRHPVGDGRHHRGPVTRCSAATSPSTDRASLLIHVEDTGSTVTPAYTDASVTAGGKYTYRIKAKNAAGLSPQSSYFDARAPQLPAVTVSFERSTYTVDEGQTVEIAVLLGTDPERTVNIPIVATNQDDASESDHSGAPSKVTFESGENRQVITLTATDDETDDDGESVLLSFGASLPHRVSAGSVNETTVNITDNDEGEPDSVERTDEGEPDPVPTPTPEPPAEPVEQTDEDATRDGAVDLGDITGVTKTRYPTYTINKDGDAVDYFLFTITEPKFVTIGIRQLDADASITVEEEAGEVIKSKAEAGAVHVMTYGAMLEGTYYVRVDATEDGEIEYRLAHGVRDPNPDRVAELREEQESPNQSLITVQPNTLELAKGEDGAYTVVLGTQPDDDVTVTVAVSGKSAVTVDQTSLTFTQDNWDVEQVVTVTAAQDDDDQDETASVTHTVTSGDEGYDGLTVDGVSVTVTDDDSSERTRSSEPQQTDDAIRDPFADLQPVTDAADVRDDAVDLGDITHVTEARSSVYDIGGGTDAVDWFRFELTESRRVSLVVSEFDADVSLTLEDEAGAELASTDEGDSDDLVISTSLDTGVYYAKVEASEADAGTYTFEHSTIAPPSITSIEFVGPLESAPQKFEGGRRVVVREGHEVEVTIVIQPRYNTSYVEFDIVAEGSDAASPDDYDLYRPGKVPEGSTVNVLSAEKSVPGEIRFIGRDTRKSFKIRAHHDDTKEGTEKFTIRFKDHTQDALTVYITELDNVPIDGDYGTEWNTVGKLPRIVEGVYVGDGDTGWMESTFNFSGDIDGFVIGGFDIVPGTYFLDVRGTQPAIASGGIVVTGFDGDGPLQMVKDQGGLDEGIWSIGYRITGMTYIGGFYVTIKASVSSLVGHSYEVRVIKDRFE